MGLETKKLKADLCVVGGGMAGVNVAITAARLGVKVVLIHERPVYGGNASGEVRMWVRGCIMHGYKHRETGLTEEIYLDNLHGNPTKNYYLWDAILYHKVHAEGNVTALLNATCFDAKMTGDKICSVTAYQMTTQTLYEVEADFFADCSGDSILAPLTGAEFMWGREAKSEYNEPMQTHEGRDRKTMGNSCLIQARKTGRKVPFHAPDWAEKVSVEKLKSKKLNLYNPTENFWYIELGGVLDTIKDAEYINKRLVALCLGVWDTVKNSGEFDADEFELDFIGFLGAKRESRRMTGDYVLTANDIQEAKAFPDIVAYGGWPLDDHNPEGFDGDKSNYNIDVSKPYGIPYRCLYSKNVKNLFFAGRNISATHMAMSSARVMGTCAVIGQAVGAAAWIAKKYGVMPRGVGEHIDELQQLLLYQDCYLPNVERRVSPLCKRAKLVGAETFRDGKDRTLKAASFALLKNGESVRYVLDEPENIQAVRLVFDSDLKRETFDMHTIEKHCCTRCNTLDNSPIMHMPKTLAKSFSVELISASGEKITMLHESENCKRFVLLLIEKEAREIILTLYENWGGTNTTNVFSFEID